MSSLRTSITSALVSILLLTSLVVANYWPDDGGDFSLETVKRGGGMKPVPFPCNGYDYVPRCLHGGRGPRKTWTKSGRFCVCLCPSKWVGPECGYAADSFPGK